MAKLKKAGDVSMAQLVCIVEKIKRDRGGLDDLKGTMAGVYLSQFEADRIHAAIAKHIPDGKPLLSYVFEEWFGMLESGKRDTVRFSVLESLKQTAIEVAASHPLVRQALDAEAMEQERAKVQGGHGSAPFADHLRATG